MMIHDPCPCRGRKLQAAGVDGVTDLVHSIFRSHPDDDESVEIQNTMQKTGKEILEMQNTIVKEGVKRVDSAGRRDERMQKILATEDEEDIQDREKALAAMMGIQHGLEDTNTAPVDLTAVRARRSLDRVEAVRGCATFECLRVAHERPPGRATFNFPHFMIAGWQKSATTSLHYHLVRHPSVMRPWYKEPEFFSFTCHFKIPDGCAPEDIEDYIQKTMRVQRYGAYDGKLAGYEASTHYSRLGHIVAPALAKEMPWLKIILLMREPISRAASMLIHLLDKSVKVQSGVGGCLSYKNMDLGHCLLHDSQLSTKKSPSNYSFPLKAWIESFPKDQVYIGQYENLIDESKQAAELRKIKRFLDLDPTYPSGKDSTLDLRNSRKGVINPDGWPMKKSVYQQLVDLVRPDCRKVAELIEENGFGKKADWMKRWESVWENNFKTCDDQGNCLIRLS